MRFDPAARAWVEAELGTPVRRVRRVHGGVASVIHRVDTGLGWFALRRVTREPWPPNDIPAEDIRREAQALRALTADAGVPELVVADVEGVGCGWPASIQTWLPGRPVTAPRNLDDWLDALATAVAVTMGSDVDLDQLERYQPWFRGVEGRATWSSSPDRWAKAFEELSRSVPGGRDGLVHRDLHPGNVLLHRGRYAGVVDWTNACRGPLDIDVAKCTVEVALLAGIEAGDGLRDRCRPLVPDYDRRWEAVACLELEPIVPHLLSLNQFGSSLTVEGMRATLDALLAAAVG